MAFLAAGAGVAAAAVLAFVGALRLAAAGLCFSGLQHVFISFFLVSFLKKKNWVTLRGRLKDRDIQRSHQTQVCGIPEVRPTTCHCRQ